MIRRTKRSDGVITVTFALPDTGQTVAVVADFNDWDPTAHPLRKRSNGTRSVAVPMEPGRTVRFRYLTADGTFFDDDCADDYEPNGYGQTHAVLQV